MKEKKCLSTLPKSQMSSCVLQKEATITKDKSYTHKTVAFMLQ